MSPRKNYNFVIRVIVEKVPIFQKKLNKISRFEYRPALYFYDLVKDEKVSYAATDSLIEKMIKSLDIYRNSSDYFDELELQDKLKLKNRTHY